MSEAKIVLGAVDNTRPAFDSVKSSLNGLHTSATKVMGALGATISIAGLAAFVKSGIDAADALDEMSGRVGISVKELSSLQLAYKQAGMGPEAMQSSLAKLSKGMSDNNAGLKALGVNTRNADGSLRTTTGVLLDIADKFEGMQDGASKTAHAMEIFGKSGAEMVPLLNGGSEGIREMTAMAEKLGLVMEGSAAAQAGKFNDTLELLGLGVSGVGQQIAAELLPTLSGLAGEFLTTMTEGDRLKNTAGFLSSALKVLYIGGIGIVEVFSSVGKVVGGSVAAILAALSGNFSEAWDTLKNVKSDFASGWSEAGLKMKAAWETTGNASVESAAKQLKSNKDLLGAEKAREEAAKAGAAAANKSAQEQHKLIESGTELAKSLLAQDSGLSGDFAKKWDSLSAAYKANAFSVDILVASQTELLSQQPAMKAAQDAIVKAAQLAADARHKEADGIAAWLQALDQAAAQSLAGVKDRITSLQDEERALALSQAQHISLAEAVELVAIARLREKQDGFFEGSEGYLNIQKEIDARTQLAQMMGGKAKRDEWTESVKQYDDIFRKGFSEMVNGGEGVWKSFTKSLVTTFKTGVADQIYKMFAQPFVMKIVASLLGVAGGSAVSGVANAATDISGGSMMGAFSAGKGIYDAISGGFANLGASVTGQFSSFAVSSMGQSMGLSTVVEAVGPAIEGGLAPTMSVMTESASGMASAAGTFASYAGAAMAGIGIGSAIAGDKVVLGVDGTSAAVIGAAIGSIFGPVGTLVGGVIGGVVNAAFGMGAKKSTGEGIRGTLSASAGASAQNYNTWAQEGGWFRSDKSGTEYGGVSSDMQKYLDYSVVAITSTTKAYASAIGLSAESVDGYTKAIDVSLAGLDGAGQKAAIDAALGGFGISMAETLLGAFAVVKEGETASTTLARLATSLVTVNSTFDALGHTLLTTSLAGADAASKLIDVFGGVEKFAQLSANYYENFHSAEEQRLQAIKNINAATAGSGLDAATATRESFRKLVEAQDVTTASGRQTYAALLNVAGAFAAIAPAAQSAASAMLDAAKIGASDAMAALSRSVDAEKTRQTEAYNAQLAAYTGQLDSVATSVGKLQSLASSLKSTLDGMRISGSDSSYRLDAQAQISAALAAARSGGGLPLDGQLASALATVSKPSEQMFATFADYARDFYKTANDISALGDLTGQQLSADEITQGLLKDQIRAITSNHESAMRGLDSLVTVAQAQLDATMGTNKEALTISAAIKALADAMVNMTGAIISALSVGLTKAPDAIKQLGAATGGSLKADAWNTVKTATGATDVWASSGGAASIGSGASQQIYAKDGSQFSATSAIASVTANLAADNAAQVYADATRTGISAASLDALMGWGAGTSNAWATANDLPKFAAGINSVPYDMDARIHKDERIFPAADNRELMARLRSPQGGGADNSEMVAEMRALRATVERQQIALDKIARSTGNSDRTLTNVTEGGTSLKTTAV